MGVLITTSLHAVGLGFESLVAHPKPAYQAGLFVSASPTAVPVLPFMQKLDLLLSSSLIFANPTAFLVYDFWESRGNVKIVILEKEGR